MKYRLIFYFVNKESVTTEDYDVPFAKLSNDVDFRIIDYLLDNVTIRSWDNTFYTKVKDVNNIFHIINMGNVTNVELRERK